MGVADQNYYLDDKGNVVTEEDPNQAIQIVAKGCEITQEMADKYGIGKVAQEEQDEEPVIADEAKASKPSSNKARKPASNKGVK